VGRIAKVFWSVKYLASNNLNQRNLAIKMQAPIMVLNANTKREQGKTAQKANITAAKAVSDIVRTTLGPKSMLKMLLDPMGGIVLTNDGNAILREVSLPPNRRTFSRSQIRKFRNLTFSPFVSRSMLLTPQLNP